MKNWIELLIKKSEIRSSKHETISNDQIAEFKTIKAASTGSLLRFRTLFIRMLSYAALAYFLFIGLLTSPILIALVETLIRTIRPLTIARTF